MLELIADEQPVMRARVLERFARDGERETIAVLTDLVSSGLVYASGRGANSMYCMTSDAARQRLVVEADADGVADLLWGSVYGTPGVGLDALRSRVSCSDAQWEAALNKLVQDGRVRVDQTPDGPQFHAQNFLIRVGSERGWESAIFDHLQAVTSAIGAKLARGTTRTALADQIGGSTLRFQIEPRRKGTHYVYVSLRVAGCLQCAALCLHVKI